MKSLRKSFSIVTILLFLFVNLTPAQAKGEVIFEGFYKVSLNDIHSGYAIQRFELDAKKKEFKSIYYIYVRTSPDGKKFLTESLVSRSNDKFHPLAYNYTAIIDGKPVTIDAKFPKGKMVANVNKGGKPQKATKPVPKGTFMSSMLLFLILQKGVGVGKNFSYNAIAEEDAKIMPGTVSVSKEVPYKGIKSFQLDYSFKNVKSIAYIAENGNVLYSEAPAQKVKTELVSNSEMAVTNFPFPKKTLKTLFGAIPTGLKNIIAEQKSSPPPEKKPVDQ